MRLPSSIRMGRLSTALLLLNIPIAWAVEPVNQEQEQTATLPAVQVKATKSSGKTYQPAATRAISKLNTSAKDTAQSVSNINQHQIQDFQLNSINEALAHSAGVLVEAVETDRTYYTSRGFDITNFQIDGLGLPMLHGNVYGSLDLALYERLEVLSGANGLSSVYGDPSATVNFVRKRPTASNKTTLKVTAGSWEQGRVDVDSNVVLSDAVRVRGVAAASTTQSYLERYGKQKQVFGGILEADVTANTQLSVGVSHQDEHADSPMWGALPVVYADGTPHAYPRNTSSAADWAYWNNLTQHAFMELEHRVSPEWSIKTTLSHTKHETDSKLFYVYGNEDKTTGKGLKSYPSRYDLDHQQSLVDITVSGEFDGWGQRHELAFGGQWSQSSYHDTSYYGKGIGTDVPPLAGWNGQYPEPTFDAAVNGSEVNESQISVFAVAKWALTDDLQWTTGARLMDLSTSGKSYGSAKNRKIEQEFVPYTGLVYALNPRINLYGSVAKTFTPQAEIDINRQPLAPKEGMSYEVGMKAEMFDQKALATVALFQTEQDQVAIQGGTIPNSTTAYYVAQDGIHTQGVELQLAGMLAKGLELNTSYTHAIIRDKDDQRINTFAPKQFARISTTYQLPMWDAVKVGSSIRWQDDIYGQAVNVKQSAYTLIDLMAQYQINPQLSATFNVNNVTNEKYWQSLYWAGLFGQAYYGAPREFKASLSWSF